MLQIPPPLPADERRRATATTGGFIFQWWLSVLAWLELNDDEVLYVESSEDFEVVSPARGTTVQAKAGTQATLTLRSAEVLAALNHFWQLATQERRSIRFVLLAQAAAGVEQGAPFGVGMAGLDRWMESDRAPSVDEQLRRFLCDDVIVAPQLVPSLQQFLRDASPEEFRQRLRDRIVFDLGHEAIGAVRDLVRDRLVVLAVERHGATVAEAERVAEVLFSHVVHLAASKERIPLGRTHLLRLLEEHIVQHRQRIGLALPPLGSGLIGVGGMSTLWEPPSNDLILPPLPERILARRDLVARLRGQMATLPALVLVGSTGMGKTTLAKLTARELPGTWWWLDLQGCPPAAAQLALRTILAVADRHRGGPLNVVLDGFMTDGLPTAALNTLRAIAWLARHRGGKMILTTQKQPTPTDLAAWGWTEAATVFAPRMESAEIAAFMRELGCPDTALADLWAAAIDVHTQGHPQLVHAAGLWLHQQGWPEFDGQTFQASASTVDAERAQARSLLARLTSEELELLTRLSVLGDSFRRDHALGLAEKLERLPGAAFRFDALVGPWIEPVTASGYFRLSPLLTDSAAAVAAERRRQLETACALTRLENRPVYFPDAALALRHALSGEASSLVAQITSKFLLTDQEDRARAFPSLLWLMWFSEAAIDTLFPAHPGAVALLHLLRFQIAATLMPAQVEPYIEACERQMTGLPAGQSAGQRFVLLGDVLMHCAKHLSAAQILRYLEDAARLTDSLEPEVKAEGWFPRAVLPPSLRMVPDDERVRISLAGLVLSQVGGQSFVTELVAALDELPAERRAKLLRAFGAWPTLLTLLIDKIWLGEAEKAPPAWESLLAWLSATAAKSAAWRTDVLVVPLTRAASVVCNEYLNDPDRAASLLASVEATTRGYSALLLDQAAKIAAQKNQLPEALAAVKKALAEWEDSDFGLHPKMLALQRAGTWAGKLEAWKESAEHFAQAAGLARRLRLIVSEAGLETDGAVARWRANEPAAALAGFARALELCGQMGPANSDLAIFQFQKVLGHILLSLAMGYRRSASSPPQAPVVPGMASELALDEKVKTLPPPRLTACKVFVAMLEHNHGLGDALWNQYQEEGLNSQSLSTRNFALELAIRKAVNRADLGRLPALASRQASVLAVTRAAAANLNATEQFQKNDDADLPAVAWDFTDQLCGEPLFLAGLISSATQRDNLIDVLHELETQIAESPFSEALLKWVQRAQAIATATEAQAHAIARSGTTESDRVIASLVLLCQPRLAPEVLWGALYVVLVTLNGMYWGADVLRQLDKFAGARWRAAADNRFAFRNPTLWLPELKALCSSPVTGTKRLAALLLAARPALDLKMDKNIATQLQQMREGQTTTSWQQIAPGFR